MNPEKQSNEKNNTEKLKKKQQRLKIKERSKQLSPLYTRLSDEEICKQIIALPEFQQADTIFCFVNMPTEIDTTFLITYAWDFGKTVVVPKCIRPGIMELYQIRSYDDLETGCYGIREPKSTCRMLPADAIDFAVIPCVSCDLSGHRLGHGGGYYDRYLEHATFSSAVICREQLLLESVACEPHDQTIPIVVTETGVWRTAE